MNKMIMVLVIPLILEAQSISQLFEAVKNHTQTKVDELKVQQSKIEVKRVDASLYPQVNLFTSYNHYTTATGMVPVPPNQLLDMVKDQSVAQPFSQDIFRAGARFSMPIFVKSIYTTALQAKKMQKSVEAKKRLNLLTNEALIVGSNATFIYFISLKKALKGKEDSLLETQKTLKIKVDDGRLPASTLYKIEDSLNEIAIEKNNINLELRRVVSSIESLTGVRLTSPASMKKVLNYKKGTFKSLQAFRERINAQKIDIKVQKEKLYPALYADGSYVYSQSKAYNNDKNIDETYGTIGVVLNIPLLHKEQYEAISLSKITLQTSQAELKKEEDELKSKANMLSSSLPLLENSLQLYRQSIENKKKLLKIAKVNFNSGRLSTEEYLRYEDAVVVQEANLYKTKAIQWQTEMQLAVIYANNIEEMVR